MTYRHGGERKLLSFGPCLEVSLAEARAKRDAAKALLAAGLDPAEHLLERVAGADAAPSGAMADGSPAEGETVGLATLAITEERWHASSIRPNLGRRRSRVLGLTWTSRRSVAAFAFFVLLAAGAPQMPRLLPDDEIGVLSFSERAWFRLESALASSVGDVRELLWGAEEAIEHPGKLGVAGFPKHGVPRLIDDMEALGAAWFYDFSADLPNVDVEGWDLGDDATMVSDESGFSLALYAGEHAWAHRFANVEAGVRYDLLFVNKSGRGARGGVGVDFLDAHGTTLGGRWLAVDGERGPKKMADLVAPSVAVRARVVVWGETNGVVVDDLRLVRGGTDVLRKGGFDAVREAAPASGGAQFVPMVWGAAATAPEALARLGSPDVILGFNEPDFPTQSIMTVDEAIALWPRLMATGARLGSPATTTPGTLGRGSWLARFMKRVEAEDLRVDFIAVHYYSNKPSTADFRRFLMKVHAAYGRPVWVTEWALIDWRNHGRFSAEETARFLRDGALMMDELDFVERHAWFGAYDGLDALSLNSHLIDADGTLTQAGEAFASFVPKGRPADEGGQGTSASNSSAPAPTTAKAR